MSDLVFGVVWLVLTLSVSLCFIVITPFAIIVFLPLYYIGFKKIKEGRMKLQKDEDTEKYGEICYGRIRDVYPTGMIVNGEKEYNVKIYFYIPSLKKEEKAEEVIGFNYYEYNKGEYVKLKYYKDDINIMSKVDKSEVPQKVLDLYENIAELNSNIIYHSNERLQPMDIPTNGFEYEWEKKEDETIR